MANHVPYARSDVGSSRVDSLVEWLGVNNLLEVAKLLPSETEFTILLDFLVEFVGGLELTEHRMAETLVEPAAISYMAYAETVQRVKHRLIELYNRSDTAIPSRLEES